jgi:phosphoesterase RecJ-like protein
MMASMSFFQDQKPLSRVRELLSAPRKVAVVTHHNPDGDAIGSSLGLAGILAKKGHNITVITPNAPAGALNWMAGAEKILPFAENPEKAHEILLAAELIFCLDFNTPKQGGAAFPSVAEAKGVKVMIDHHLEPGDFCDIVFSYPKAAATAELVWHFIAALGWDDLCDAGTASALYTGLMTDTGNFRFNSVTPELHETVAALLRHGAKPDAVYEQVFENTPINALRLLGFALSEKLQVLESGKVAVMSLSADEQKRFDARKADIDDLVNFGLKIAGVRFVALFYETGGQVRGSFRSKGGFSARDFAAKHYGGGGHFNAAGGSSTKSVADTVAEFIRLASDPKVITSLTVSGQDNRP